MNHEVGLRPIEIELSLAGDLPEQFTKLRQALDKKRFIPLSEVHNYTFSTMAILYAHPPAVRSLLELYDSDVEKVTVTTHEELDSPATISIRIYTETAGILEIAPPTSSGSSAAYVLNQVDGATVNHPIEVKDISDFLVSMAVSPDDQADIDRARRSSTAAVTSLDPRDPSVFYLLKNSLDTYASEFSTVERYRLRHDSPYEDAPIDADLYITKVSNGSEYYDLELSSSHARSGYGSAFGISTSCHNGINPLDSSVAIQGVRHEIAGSHKYSEPINKTAALSYVGTVVDALSQSIVTSR